MINKVTRVKLVVFVAITVVALSLTALNYVRLPQQVGIGRYGVDVELRAAGGLYPQAAVTYRGVEIGKVTDVELRPGGSALARLQIDNGVDIPANSLVEVRSSSVIGEQYINFVPAPDGDAASPLGEGDTVPAERTVLPTTTDELLTSVDGLLQSVPVADLRTAVSEADRATRGAGDELGRLIADSHRFQKAANRNLPETIALLNDAVPVLGTQRGLDPSIRSYARDLATLSGALADADSQLQGVLEAGAPFMRRVGSISGDLRPVLPGMIGELADTGEVLNVYRDSIEHILVLAPAVVPAVNAIFPPNQRGKYRNFGNLYFKLGFDPPTCTVGFRDAGKMRDPSDVRTVDPAPSDWCKVPPADERVVRGARNDPCPNGGRAATAALCGLVFDDSVVTRYRTAGTGSRPTLPGATGSVDRTAFALLLEGDREKIPGSLTDLLMGLVS